MELPPKKRRVRVAVKRFLYSLLYQRDVFRLLYGGTKPLLPFKVEATPPSVYYNFEIQPSRVDDLREALDLPFPLLPLRCLEDDDPFYCLTLNIYRVSGLAIGIRAEWSLYIEDHLGKPRYLVVDAQSDNPALDSVNLMTRGVEVSHSRDGDRIDSSAQAADGGHFRATCRTMGDEPLVRAAPEWIEANDYIYWLNGICDRTFYDSGLANARMRKLDAANVEVRDSTRWGDLVVPQPKHVIVFEDAIEFAISPWWNLDDMKD